MRACVLVSFFSPSFSLSLSLSLSLVFSPTCGISICSSLPPSQPPAPLFFLICFARYVAVAVWEVARNRINRRCLGHECKAVRRLLVLVPPMHVSDRLCEHICAALWLLCCDKTNAGYFARYGGLQVFIQHLRYPSGVEHRIKILSVGILRACFFWNFSSCCHILVELNLMRLLVNMIEDPNAPDRLHIEVSQTIINISFPLRGSSLPKDQSYTNPNPEPNKHTPHQTATGITVH